MLKIKEVFEKNKEISQLIYGVLLIIVIVGLISFNSFYIIKKYKKGLELSLYHQAFFAGKSITTLIKDDLKDDAKIQKKIEELIANSSEIKSLSILKPIDNNFEISASSEKENIGIATDFYLYKFAWQQGINEGVTTNNFSKNLIKNENDVKLFADFVQGGHWFVALPVTDETGQKKAILSIIISSEIEDNITASNFLNSMFLTGFILVVVILFLSLTLKLWDYVLLYKKTKEVDIMKDEFISMASHELRTPVTGIRGYTAMILDGSFGKVNKKVKDSLGIIKSSAERLATLVEDLLNVSRIEQGRIQVELKTIEIGFLVDDVIKELSVQAKEKNLKLIYNPFQKKLPLINIDSDRLKQILINIIGNAIKYTEKGSVEILANEKDNGKILEIKIKDTGIGMSAKARENLFQKFYRIQNEKTKNIIGTGLGLWITKQLVELMNGTISVDSIEGVGTQMTLQFPIVKK